MKTLILALAMLCANTGTAFAQKLTKTERKAKKQERIDETEKLVKQMYQTATFTFVPTEVSAQASKPFVIIDYEALILKPQYLDMDLTTITPYILENQAQSLQITTPLFKIVTNEATKTGYKMVITTETNQQRYTFTFNTNASTASTKLQVLQSEGIILNYKGSISNN